MRTQDIIKQEIETTVASEPVNVSNDSIFEPVVECREYPFKISDDDADFIFFKSLLQDFKSLSKRRQRDYKVMALTTLNKLSNDQESEMNCTTHNDSYF